MKNKRKNSLKKMLICLAKMSLFILLYWFFLLKINFDLFLIELIFIFVVVTIPTISFLAFLYHLWEYISNFSSLTIFSDRYYVWSRNY